MDETLYYVLGSALVLAALALTAVGIRWVDSFPSRQAMMAGSLALGALVIGTMVFAVLNARAEQEHREQELAEEEAAAEENAGAESAGAAPEAQSAEEPTPTTEGQQPEGEQGGPQEAFEITSPEDGSLSFEPDGIQAAAGTITLAYTNPSPVTHNIYLEDENQDVLAESEDVVDGTVEITSQLSPGEYLYFCAIPGHREGGMEGTLTVE